MTVELAGWLVQGHEFPPDGIVTPG